VNPCARIYLSPQYLGWLAGLPEQISRWPNGSFGGLNAAISLCLGKQSTNASLQIFLGGQPGHLPIVSGGLVPIEWPLAAGLPLVLNPAMPTQWTFNTGHTVECNSLLQASAQPDGV
jgi:hypothetical protein